MQLTLESSVAEVRHLLPFRVVGVVHVRVAQQGQLLEAEVADGRLEVGSSWVQHLARAGH